MTTRGLRKTRTGVVVSDKMDKTIVVLIVRKWKHPRYGKMVKSSKKYKAHDEENTAKQGDMVLITETRPISKDKRWRLVEVVKAAK
ncbi:MAG: 30S ribosomal protein S17 [Clostridia bacterium]|jgi:small subunit ribosomal protein S17|nr:30S ribosomal protein S17 [Clostridia bacterium]